MDELQLEIEQYLRVHVILNISGPETYKTVVLIQYSGVVTCGPAWQSQSSWQVATETKKFTVKHHVLSDTKNI